MNYTQNQKIEQVTESTFSTRRLKVPGTLRNQFTK